MEELPGTCLRGGRAAFLPVRTESLDLCIAESYISDPRVLGLIRLLHSRSFRRLLSDLPGLDNRHTGTLGPDLLCAVARCFVLLLS